MTYDLTKPAFSRVVSVSVRCLECSVPSYSPLSQEDVYSVLVSSFIIGGGDGYSMFTKEKITHERFSKLANISNIFYFIKMTSFNISSILVGRQEQKQYFFSSSFPKQIYFVNFRPTRFSISDQNCRAEVNLMRWL